MGFLSNLFGPSVPKLTATDVNEKLKFGKHPLVIDVISKKAQFSTGRIPSLLTSRVLEWIWS
jgi:hypothetical protein